MEGTHRVTSAARERVMKGGREAAVVMPQSKSCGVEGVHTVVWAARGTEGVHTAAWTAREREMGGRRAYTVAWRGRATARVGEREVGAMM
jgi:hypothetical protein